MEKKHGSLYELDGVPKLGEAIPVGVQHVLAMVIGCITPAILIGATAKLDGGDKVIIIQMSLVIAGLATLLQNFPIWKIGAKAPLILGAGFAYLPTVLASIHLAPTQDPKEKLAYVFGAQIVGAIVAIIFGVFVKFLLPLFPPLVTGTVVFVIGLSLYPVGMRYMGGNGNVGFGWVKQVVNGKDMLVAKGVGSLPAWGNWKYWLVAIITLVVVIFLTNFTTGITKIASILFAIIVGYIVSIPLGLVDFSSVAKASLVPKIATPLYFGLKFDPAIIVGFVILFIVNSVQAIGDLSATTAGGLDRLPTSKELQGGLLGYGVTNAFAALLGCPPLSTYSQNVGIVGTTKVVNRTVMGIAAVIIIIAGVFSVVSGAITTIPPAVIGGATVSVFGSITMTGIKFIAKQRLTLRNMAVVGLSVALGMGFSQVASEAKSRGVTFIPAEVYTAFGTTPVVIATLAAILLNILIKAKPIDLEQRPE